MANTKAKATDKAKNGAATDEIPALKFKRVPTTEIKQKLTRLRAGTGGGTSKYEPVAKWLEENIKSEADGGLEMDLTANDVGGLRGFIKRRLNDRFTVTSAKVKGEENLYATFITMRPEEKKEEASEEGATVAEKDVPAEEQAPVEA